MSLYIQVARMPRLRQKFSLAVLGILGGCAALCVPCSLLRSLRCSVSTGALRASLGCRREERGERREERGERREEKGERSEERGQRKERREERGVRREKRGERNL